MKTISTYLQQNRARIRSLAAVLALTTGAIGSQAQVARIASEISSAQLTPLKGSLHPMAQAQNDAGRMSGDTRLTGVTLAFNRSAGQKADLAALIAAQQNPASPLYHKWLTPDQFAARFGMSASDIAQVKSWLESRGFTVSTVNRSRTAIRFSGTAAQVESAFSTQMHYYKVDGEKHFAASTAISLPSSLVSVVSSVRNLNDFRPKPQHITPKNSAARPSFTSGQSGSVFFAPGDIKVAYDINPLIQAGVTGAGQTIAVMGQSSVVVSDIEAFQTAAGLTVKDPTLALVPDTGTSATSSGDESESDLDLEWSGAIATGANVLFVYTGNSANNNGVFDAMAYTVDEDLAPILSVSYGACETQFTATDITSYEDIGAQATTQGQTIIAASGDQGSTACSGTTSLSTAQQEALAVNYPASSAYVTGMGGTEISAANSVSTNSTYWTAETSGTDILTSALTYIPEVAWNDDSSQYGLSASGGGPSVLIARPSWQTGVTGIASGTFRLVPDISLYSSPNYPGYLYCTSDSSAWNSGQAASCNSGFRDSSTQDVTIAGGTSFATPVFAGMLALINQDKGYVTGQGLVNSTLYSLAADSTTYASAFHDVTSGNNNCTAGSTYCSSTTGFSAGTGYDEVTGLGSIDVYNLANAWPTNAGTTAGFIGTTTTVSASNTSPTAGASVTFTITVAGVTGSGTPSGTVNLSIDGGGTAYSSSGTTATATLASNGTATYTTSFTTAGTHSLVAKYAGDTTYATSTGTASVTVGSTSTGTGTFTLGSSPSTLTVSQGNSGSETITVTSKSSYAGTVGFTMSTTSTSLQNNGCYTVSNAAVTANASATTTLVVYTSSSACNSAAKKGVSTHPFVQTGGKSASSSRAIRASNKMFPAGAAAIAGVVLFGFRKRRAKWLTAIGCFALLGIVGLSVGCGSSSTSTSSSNVAKGSYTLTVTGTDTSYSSITGTTSFTLTVD